MAELITRKSTENEDADNGRGLERLTSDRDCLKIKLTGIQNKNRAVPPQYKLHDVSV